MKKLGKIQLQNALVLEEREMKSIYGGSSGGGSSSGGGNASCITSCGSGFTTVGPSYFETGAEWAQYLWEMNEILCGTIGTVSCSGYNWEINT